MNEGGQPTMNERGTSTTQKWGNERTTGTTYDEQNHNERTRRDNKGAPPTTEGNHNNERGRGGTGNDEREARVPWTSDQHDTPLANARGCFSIFIFIFVSLFLFLNQ
jgi:hypothetical protein